MSRRRATPVHPVDPHEASREVDDPSPGPSHTARTEDEASEVAGHEAAALESSVLSRSSRLSRFSAVKKRIKKRFRRTRKFAVKCTDLNTSGKRTRALSRISFVVLTCALYLCSLRSSPVCLVVRLLPLGPQPPQSKREPGRGPQRQDGREQGHSQLQQRTQVGKLGKNEILLLLNRSLRRTFRTVI